MNGLWNTKDSLAETKWKHKELVHIPEDKSPGRQLRDEASEELSLGVLLAGRAPCVLHSCYSCDYIYLCEDTVVL